MARKRTAHAETTVGGDGAAVAGSGGCVAERGVDDTESVVVGELNQLMRYATDNGLAKGLVVNSWTAKATLGRSKTEPMVSVWFGSEMQDMQMLVYSSDARHWIIDSDVKILKTLLQN